MRARYADYTGAVERDGVALGYEVYGEGGSHTILLMPTWTIIHCRSWKMQIPFLSRYYRVVTYDGPGNGRSDRVTDAARYSADEYAADAVAVLDDCDIDQVVAVGHSLGSQYATRLASLHPDRVLGLAMIGPALPLVHPIPERAAIAENFAKPYPDDPKRWDKYNAVYWRDHYEDFTRFFFAELFSEPHSTKPIEDAVAWASETSPSVLEAEAFRPRLGIDGTTASITSFDEAISAWTRILADLTCPVFVIHGTHDRIQPHRVGVEAARITGGTFLSIESSGHSPHVRDPVRFNRALKHFVDRVAA